MKRTLPSSTLLSAAVLAFATFMTGCLGSSRSMQPQVLGQEAAVDADTSCAGDVCFHYAADAK